MSVILIPYDMNERESSTKSTFVIIGGGIAGITCARTLSSHDDQLDVVLISASPTIKLITNHRNYGQNLEQFEVEESTNDPCKLNQQFPKIKFVRGVAVSIESKRRTVHYKPLSEPSTSIETINYDKICICTGSVPKSLSDVDENQTLKDSVLMIRDTQTVECLSRRLQSAKCVVVVGNGGIATELVYRISDCKIIWVIRESSIGASFFDDGAAKFFLDSLKHRESTELNVKERSKDSYIKRSRYTVMHADDIPSDIIGSALGPDWTQNITLAGDYKPQDVSENGHANECLTIKYNSEVASIRVQDSTHGSDSESKTIIVELTTGEKLTCNLVINATGVVPNTQFLQKGNLVPDLKFDTEDGDGILVDNEMRTSITDIYAAGDACSCNHWISTTGLWFQKRLWTQARQMGHYAALCMISHRDGVDPSLYCNFTDCFTHVTNFFGYKVVLLGAYLAQGIDNYEVMIRVNPNVEYVRLILKEGRIKGAVLVGETELEETFENLIHNQIDVSCYGEQLLDGTVDIDDYFD